MKTIDQIEVPIEATIITVEPEVDDKPMLPCPECGKHYKGKQGLGAHRKFSHGIAGEHSADKRNKTRHKPKADKPAPAVESPRDVALAFVMHLAGDSIPTAELPAVLDWISSTEDLCRRLQ